MAEPACDDVQGAAHGSRGVRVLLLCESLAVTGGVERFVCRLGSDLAALGMEVAVGSADRPGTPTAFPVSASVRVLCGGKIPGGDRGSERDIGANHRAWRLLKTQWRVGRALGRLDEGERADVVVLNGVVVACAALLLRPSMARRTICCDHNHFGARSRFWQRLRALVYPRVAAVVSLTAADAPRFAAINANTRVIANASTLVADEPALPAAPHVLAVGRLQAQKGFDLLLRAWVDVVATHPGARLRIVGEGPLRRELRALAGQLGVDSSVDWLPPTDAVEALYRGAAVFVLSSRYEGMPLALLEAQALGVPAVAFDCPTGPSDIVSADTGVLVATEDCSALAAAIVGLLGDAPRRARMGRAAIARSRELFGPERHVESWATLIRDVADAHRGSRP
ncbi:MAG: glycosyltransferase [Caldimonas sp.]